MEKLTTYSIIIGALTALFFIGVGVYFWYGANHAPATSAPTAITNQSPTQTTYVSQTSNTSASAPTSTTTPAGTSGQEPVITIPGEDGEPIFVRDFLNASSTIKDPYNEGQYFLAGNDYLGQSVETYTILYAQADQSFTIGLNREPLKAVREQAEQYLMRLLGLPGQDMCRLPYTVLVPYQVNQIYSGRNLGFSFCTGATPLP